MGQRIEVTANLIGDVLLLDTDRSLTGQDGAEYPSRDAATGDDTFPGRLATRLFESDALMSSVFVASNGVVIARAPGWDDNSVAAATRVVSDFFLFYPDAS